MSASFASSVSRSNPSEWVSTQIARSMVWSDFGLSCFDYPLDRKNRDTVCTLLTDLPFKILGVWVVGRPVNGYTNSKFEHWCVKIQAPPALISIDFLESKKRGAFGLQQTTATDAELEDFLHYFVKDENGKRKKKWHIISSVTPSPLKNTSYLKYIDDHELRKLKAFMKKNNNKQNKINNNNVNDAELVKHININRKVCDIADFLGMWTESENQRKSSSASSLSSSSSSTSSSLSSSLYDTNKYNNNNHKKMVIEKTYNPITGNCQQFAADLFQYLVGHKKQYIDKVKEVKVQVQSPFDKKRYNINSNKKRKSNKNKNKNNNKNNKNNNNNNNNYNDDNDEKKQEMIEEEEEEEDDINKKKSSSASSKSSVHNYNNMNQQLAPHQVD